MQQAAISTTPAVAPAGHDARGRSTGTARSILAARVPGLAHARPSTRVGLQHRFPAICSSLAGEGAAQTRAALLRFHNPHRATSDAMRAKDVLVPAVMLGGIAVYGLVVAAAGGVSIARASAPALNKASIISGCNEVRARRQGAASMRASRAIALRSTATPTASPASRIAAADLHVPLRRQGPRRAQRFRLRSRKQRLRRSRLLPSQENSLLAPS